MARKKSAAPAKKQKTASPADINTSHVLFFVAAVVAWAYLLKWYFPPSLQGVAFAIMIIFALMAYGIRFLLNQFYEALTVLRMVVFYYLLTAALSFASAVKGPLADGTLPVIQILFFGGVHISSGPALLTASIFPFYGAVTLVCAIVTAAVCELFYTLFSPALPRPLRRGLQKADARIDETSDRASWQLFGEHEWKGVAAIVIVLAGYAVAYMALLINH